MPSTPKSTSANDNRGRDASKTSSVRTASASAVSSSTRRRIEAAHPQRRASQAVIKPVDLSTGSYVYSWDPRKPQPPVRVDVQSIRKDKEKDQVFVVIRPNPEHDAVEVRLETLSGFSLDRHYKQWDKKARVANRLLKEVKLECVYRIDDASGQLQVLSTEWPYSQQPRPKKPSMPIRAARQATEAVFNGALGLAVVCALGRR